MSFRYLYNEKTPATEGSPLGNSTIDFMKHLIEYFPFRVHCIQTAAVGSACGNSGNNGTEFTYRKHLFDTEHPLDKFCKNKNIKRVYSPVASPWYC